MVSKKEPTEQRLLTYFAFLLIGTGTLLAWNIVISAVDFFEDVFPGADAMYWMSIAYQSMNMIGLIIMMRYSDVLSFRGRILSGFVVIAIIMSILPLIREFWIAVLLVAVFGLMNAAVQGTLFGLAGIYSPFYMSGFMAGQGLGGLFPIVLRMITKGALPDEPEGSPTGAYIFFYIAVAFLLGCVFVFEFILRPSKITQYFAATASTQIMQEFGALTASKSDLYSRLPDAVEEGRSDDYDATKPAATRALLSEDQLSGPRSWDASSPQKDVAAPLNGTSSSASQSSSASHSSASQSSKSATLTHENVQTQMGGDSSSRAVAAGAAAASPQSDGSRLRAQKDIESVVSKDTLALDDTRPQPQTYREIYANIYPYVWNIFYSFFITLALFPGITADLESTDPALNLETGNGWYPLILIALFNVGDMIGRAGPQWYQISSKATIVFGVLRTIFVFLFFVSYVNWPPRSDWYSYIVMLAFAASNGYVSTMSMIYGTGDLVDANSKDAAGTIMIFFLSAGLTAGVWAGYGFKYLFDLA